MLFETYRAKSSLFAAAFATDDLKDVPQELKPSSVRVLCGTAEAVPFVQNCFTLLESHVNVRDSLGKSLPLEEVFCCQLELAIVDLRAGYLAEGSVAEIGV